MERIESFKQVHQVVVVLGNHFGDMSKLPAVMTT